MPGFWSHVDKNGPVHPVLGTRCWLWTGGRGGKGRLDQQYGQYGTRRAHRFAYELLVGSIPHGRVTDHLCRRRECVNPQHLELVTHKINILRGEGLAALNARKTHCDNGHELAGDNLMVVRRKRRGGATERACRTCANARKRKWQEAQC